jgi:hypothetical protein
MRKAGRPTTNPTTNVIAAAAGSVARWFQSWSATRMAVV